MDRISKLELLDQFGFSKDPFRQFIIASSDFTRIGKITRMAIQNRVMLSVIGERGIGKSNAVFAAIKKLKNVRLVYPYANDINKLLIGDIEQALIMDLSSEKPKRGREIRARQLRRILGDAQTQGDVVLVIEEAHNLHGMTLRALKRLREMQWAGETELLSIILVGQSDPLNKPGVSEVRLRADSIQMKGLSQKEIVTFVKRAFGNVFEKDAISMIGDMPGNHNYEDLKETLYRLMTEALLEGRKVVTAEDVERISGGVDLETIRKRAGVTKKQLAEETGLSAPTVAKLLNNKDESTLTSSGKENKNTLRGVLESHGMNVEPESKQAAMG